MGCLLMSEIKQNAKEEMQQRHKHQVILSLNVADTFSSIIDAMK